MRDDYRIGVNGTCPKCGRRITTTYCMNCTTSVQTYDRGDGLLVGHKDYLTLLADRDRLVAANAELKRRCDLIVASLKPDGPPVPGGMFDKEIRVLWRAGIDLHKKALAIAEGRDNE